MTDFRSIVEGDTVLVNLDVAVKPKDRTLAEWSSSLYQAKEAGIDKKIGTVTYAGRYELDVRIGDITYIYPIQFFSLYIAPT